MVRMDSFTSTWGKAWGSDLSGEPTKGGGVGRGANASGLPGDQEKLLVHVPELDVTWRSDVSVGSMGGKFMDVLQVSQKSGDLERDLLRRLQDESQEPKKAEPKKAEPKKAGWKSAYPTEYFNINTPAASAVGSARELQANHEQLQAYLEELLPPDQPKGLEMGDWLASQSTQDLVQQLMAALNEAHEHDGTEDAAAPRPPLSESSAPSVGLDDTLRSWPSSKESSKAKPAGSWPSGSTASAPSTQPSEAADDESDCGWVAGAAGIPQSTLPALS